MKLSTDEFGFRIQGFAPNTGKTYSGTVTVTTPTIVKFGGDVVITINGKAVTYYEGEGIVLLPNISYIFGTSVDCHIME